jgi:chemotaxis protein MotB
LTGGEAPQVSDVEVAQAMLERAATQLRDALQSVPSFKELADQVEIQVTPEGLRIELLESPDDSFFAVGRAELRPDTVELLHVIADELAKLPNHVAIEGHTDSRPYTTSAAAYGNWELSADRANAARRVIEEGLPAHRIEAVRGFADTRLRYPDQPLDARNRRISVVVRREG